MVVSPFHTEALSVAFAGGRAGDALERRGEANAAGAFLSHLRGGEEGREEGEGIRGGRREKGRAPLGLFSCLAAKALLLQAEELAVAFAAQALETIEMVAANCTAESGTPVKKEGR